MSVKILARWLVVSALAVQPAQDLDRLAPEAAIERLVILVGELAGAVVEVGVAELAVFGLARGL